MPEDRGLDSRPNQAPTDPLLALLLDGAGGARRLEREERRRWTPAAGALWVQLDPASPEAQRWLAEESGLPPGDQDRLLRPARQTRVEMVDGDLMVAMRGLVLDSDEPGWARIAAREHRLISVSRPALPAFRSCVDLLARGRGPHDIASVLLAAARAGHHLDQRAALNLDERVANLAVVAERDPEAPLGRLPELHRQATALRRRLTAEREALTRVIEEGPTWLLDAGGDRWRDLSAGAAELVDAIDADLDRMHGLREAAQNQQAAVLNDRLYILTLVSTIMLPLSFLTGLLGVNVGGIPARETAWAFPLLCLLLIGLGVVEYWLLRRLRWFPKRPLTQPPPAGAASMSSAARASVLATRPRG